jgi:two-component sensor histidine kinase
MLARRSLRTKLVAAVTVALLPVLALSAWYAVVEQRRTDLRRTDLVASAAQLAAARYRELIEGTHRLLVATCSEDTVRQSANPDSSPAILSQCEAFLGRVLEEYPGQYAGALVSDEQGMGRCSTNPGAIGVSFADREIFRMVRESKAFSLGAQVASRMAPTTVIPAALPILQGGAFRGMCSVDISLKAIGEMLAPQQAADGTVMALVDKDGGSIAGDPRATRALPVPVRVAAAIVGGQKTFRDYGQDGSLYEFRTLPLASSSLFVIAAAPVSDSPMSLIDAWGGFALTAAALGIALLVVWLGADRWCVRPLRYIQDFAGRVARGEEVSLVPRQVWGPELSSVGEGVKAMAAAIASREAELRAGLEQRDHMLREIHHRVKNNLQMISSLLNLQAGEIRSPRIRRFFGDAQNRVLTLSILHRHLYERSSWALVDFQQFISDLVRQISVGRRSAQLGQLRYHIRAPIMAVGPDIAIPIGLIVTEAVSSALDRSFEGVANPEIRIEAGDKAGMVELVIEDNASSAGSATVPRARSGFGLTLIRGLAMQLGGAAEVAVREGGGTRVSVTFPKPEEPDAHA